MTKTINAAFILLLISMVFGGESFAATNDNFCRDVVGALTVKAARKATIFEEKLIETGNIFPFPNEYAQSYDIVDAFNNGKEVVFAWSIQGSGRFVVADFYEIPTKQKPTVNHLPLEPVELGVLKFPEFIRYKNRNYLVYSETGDANDLIIAQLTKNDKNHTILQNLCYTQGIVRVETTCQHPVCGELQNIIGKAENRAVFTELEWPHAYFAPAGLSVFFPDDNSKVDFDNSNNPASIWRIGREGYIYQYVYWDFLGLGDEKTPPKLDPKLRKIAEDNIEGRFRKYVLPGTQHDRLRRTLKQQSEVLSKELNAAIDLPTAAQYFFFKTKDGRTYWAWELEDQPMGENIRILYTNPQKSEYIGTIHLKLSKKLVGCKTCRDQVLD